MARWCELNTRFKTPLHGLQIVVQALLHDEALNKSFDVVARPEGEGQPTSRWDAFFNAATAGL